MLAHTVTVSILTILAAVYTVERDSVIYAGPGKVVAHVAILFTVQQGCVLQSKSFTRVDQYTTALSLSAVLVLNGYFVMAIQFFHLTCMSSAGVTLDGSQTFLVERVTSQQQIGFIFRSVLQVQLSYRHTTNNWSKTYSFLPCR